MESKERSLALQVPSLRSSDGVEPKPPPVESDSSDSFSDEDEEDQKDYRVGGYHPVEVVLVCSVQNRSGRCMRTNTRFCARWDGDSTPPCGSSAI